MKRRIMAIIIAASIIWTAPAFASDSQDSSSVMQKSELCSDETAHKSDQNSVDGNERAAESDTFELKQMLSEVRNAEYGDVVIFGRFEQDNNLENGQEPLEWEALAVEDGKVLLLSKYALFCLPYNEKWTGVTWETSSVRAVLNSWFTNVAFNSDEAEAIAMTTLENNDNACYGIEGGNDTEDKVFLLSLDEIEKYYGIGPSKWNTASSRTSYEILICGTTDSAIAWGTWTSDKYSADGKAACSWWLRSPGRSSNGAARVIFSGLVDDFGLDVDGYCYGIRPALWLNIDS